MTSIKKSNIISLFSEFEIKYFQPPVSSDQHFVFQFQFLQHKATCEQRPHVYNGEKFKNPKV
jgi:hypothetical protein